MKCGLGRVSWIQERNRMTQNNLPPSCLNRRLRFSHEILSILDISRSEDRPISSRTTLFGTRLSCEVILWQQREGLSHLPLLCIEQELLTEAAKA